MRRAAYIIIVMTLMLFILSTPLSSGDNGPPEWGNWVIDEDTTVTGETIVVHGDVIVKNGSSLTLDNCVLMIDSKVPGHNGIEVEAGGELYVYNTTITAYQSYQYYKFDVSGKLRIESSDISNLGSFMTWGLFLKKTDNAMIKDSQIHGSGTYCNGITLQDSTAFIESTSIYNTYIGIHCWGTSNATIKYNHIWSNNIGMGITENATVWVEGSDISDNINRGIGTDQHSKVYLTDNTIKSNGRMGVWCFGDSTVDLINNVISNQDRGIQYSDRSHGKVINNIIGSNTVNGIEYGDNATGEIFGNIISSNGYGGIVCFQNAAVNISTNTISYNEKRGIELNDRSTVSIVSNSINMNKDIGIACSESSEMKIVDNIIANNDNYGIFSQLLKGGKLTAEDNYLHANNNAGVVIDFPSTVNLCNNTISAQAKEGIRVINGATPLISNCTIINSGKYDIFVSASSHPTIINTKFDLDKLFFNDTESIISIGHWLDVNVQNKNEVPVQNARVAIADKNALEVFNGTTDYEGRITCIPVVEYDLGYTFNKTVYTPHSIYASKLGKSASEKITVDRNRVINLTLAISDKLARGNLVTTIVKGHEVTVEYLGNGTVTIEPAKLVPELPNATKDIGIFFDIKAEGEVEDLYITVKYSDEELGEVNEAQLRMYCYLDPGDFELLDPGNFTGRWVRVKQSGVDPYNNIVWAKVSHLTIFAPLAEEIAKPGREGSAWLLYGAGGATALAISIIIIFIFFRRRKLKG